MSLRDLIETATNVGCTVGHRTPVAYTPDGGAAVSLVRSVFERDHEVVELSGEGIPMSVTRSMLWVETAELGQEPSASDRFVYGATTYEVSDVQPEAGGMVECIARRV